MEMDERACYLKHLNYPEFEDFRLAVFGFFAVLSTLTAKSVLDLLRNSGSVDFRSRVRDKFRPVGA
jgi:hypothetical protein